MMTNAEYMKIFKELPKEEQSFISEFIKKDLTQFSQKLITAIRLLNEFICEHVEVWENEIKNNDGWLNAYQLIQLQSMRKTARKLDRKYKYIPINTVYREKFLNDLKNHDLITKNRIEDDKIINLNKQGELPTENFILQFYYIGLVLERIKYSLELTVKRLKLDEEFDKIITCYNRYEKFFEKEIVMF